jgi:hypothetical protein
MKAILTIMCVMVILFAGGCALTLGAIDMNLMGGFGLPLLAAVVLNIAVLAALYGWANVPAWPLYLLAGIDFMLAAGFGVTMLSTMTNLGGNVMYGLLSVGIAALKGYLTIQVAKNKQPTD